MNRARLAWTTVGTVLAAAVLFGATRLPIGEDRYDLRLIFSALWLVLGGLLLLTAPSERRPTPLQLVLFAAFPLFVALQCLPLPRSLIGAASPATLVWLDRFWAGPLAGCAGGAALGELGASWICLALDPLAARAIFFRALALIVLFFGASSVFAGDRSLRRTLLWTVALFTAGEAVYGLTQWASQSESLLWAQRTAYLDCATGTLVNRNHFAQLLYLGLGCTLSLIAARRDRMLRGLAAERDTAVRVMLGAILALQLAGILASKSRAGLGGALIVLLPSLPLLIRGRAASRVLVVGVLVLCAVPAALLLGPTVAERVSHSADDWTSEQGRGAVFRTSLGIVSEFPAAGTGAGSFEWVFATHRPPEILGRYNYAHNDYLQVLIETGAAGLLLALAPPLVLAWGMARRWRDGKPPRRIPLLLALFAALAHELVDFGLQMPSNAALLALLAAAAFGSSREAPNPEGRGAALSKGFAAAAIALAAASLLHGVALWPRIGVALPWPKQPDALHAEANRLRQAWEENGEDTAPLCRAIDLELEAQRLRPLSAYFPVSQAKMTLAAVTSGLPTEAVSPDFEGQVRRMMDRARRLNPWNSDLRQRLMGLSLALGDVDLALEDALAAARRSPARARSIAGVLTRAGLPPLMIAAALDEQPLVRAALVEQAWRRKDWETAGALIPADPTPDPGLCEIGNWVMNVVHRVHRRDPVPFLQQCRADAVRSDDEEAAERLAQWTARALLMQERWQEAGEVVDALERSQAKNFLRLDLALGREDWNEVVRAGRSCLDSAAARRDGAREARIRVLMAQAYVRLDRFPKAVRELERAQRLDPGHPRYGELLNQARNGIDPFPRPR